MKSQIKNLEINSVEISDENNILIKGKNFNHYSIVYVDGKSIDNLLNRSQLFAGQAPESFNFKKYL